MPEFEKQQNPNQSGFLARSAVRGRSMPKPAHDDNPLLAQHQALGNQAMQRFAQSCPLTLPSASICPFGGVCHTCPEQVQPKLTVGKPGDKYEQEADRVAEQVMRMPDPNATERAAVTEQNQSTPLQRQCTECEDEELRRQPEEEEEEELLQTKQEPGQTPEVTPNIQAHNNSIKGGGHPLPESLLNYFEPRFNHDFNQVRVHTDSKAAESAQVINAQAYTVGQNIVFRAGQYAPGTATGKRLLAHELTHVVQQGNTKISFQSSQKGDIQLLRSVGIQRKLVIYSKKEAKAFKWFLTKNDAKNYKLSKGKPIFITMKSKSPAKIDDPFRFNIMKTIIDHSETLLIRGFKLDDKVTAHELYKNGKVDKKGLRPTLRAMGGTVLGAGGVTLPSASLGFAIDPKYTGHITGVANQSWIFYSTPTSLAHEYGHAFLLFSGAPWRHKRKIPKTAGIKTPGGKPFVDSVDVFISKFVAEKYAKLVLFDPKALHFSPTVIRKWPEPPDYKLTFTGTWLEFLAKYPGATVSQKIIGKGKRKRRRLMVCIPKPGEICWP